MMIETNGQPAVHDPVLVEAEIDGKVVGLRAVVVNVMPTSLWLAWFDRIPACRGCGRTNRCT